MKGVRVDPAMKYINEYRNRELISKVVSRIKKSAVKRYTFMEVCGGHTSAIHRFGIPSLLPESIRLISGPGCPVCVTATGFIDTIVACAGMDGVIVATFGDLIRVPGSRSSLEEARRDGADVRIVFSGLDALDIAIRNPERKIVFPAIGFETTAPGSAATVLEAALKDIGNFFIMSAHKVMPPVMRALLEDGAELDGFICPGHVATITGSVAFEFIPRDYDKACVIAGFEPLDLLQSILMLVGQVNTGKPSIETEYRRAVFPEGNPLAKKILSEVFEPCDTEWRGFGTVPLSGLRLKKEFDRFDAGKLLKQEVSSSADHPECICGEILRGLKKPPDCRLFAGVCTPEKPVGACMVSPEGACNSYFKYSPDE